jgi:hypothetical protein
MQGAGTEAAVMAAVVLAAAVMAAVVLAADTSARLRDIGQVVLPGADFMVAQAVGMADTPAEATIMEDVIMAVTVDTITEGMRQAGPYSELFWVE